MSLRARDNDPADQIGQARLSLSFGLADAVQSVSGRHSSTEASNSSTDMVNILALKVLHSPLFMVMELSSPDIQPTKVFHLAGKIMEGKASVPSLTVAQATADTSIIEDPEEVAKRRAMLLVEVIASFDAHISNGGGPSTSYDLLVAAIATYMSNVAARLACECRGI